MIILSKYNVVIELFLNAFPWRLKIINIKINNNSINNKKYKNNNSQTTTTKLSSRWFLVY